MKCQSCKDAEVLDTRWDKIRLWFFNRFKKDIEDLRMDYYTKGISQGYQNGFKQAVEYEKLKKETLESIS